MKPTSNGVDMSDSSAATKRPEIQSSTEWKPLDDPSPLASDSTLSSRNLIRLAWTNSGPTSFAVRALPREAVSSLEQRLGELLLLHPDWDGEGGAPPSRATTLGAAAIIAYCMAAGAPLPTIDATANGAIHAEWYSRGSIVEIEVVSGREAEFYYKLDDGRSWQGDFWHVRGNLERIFARFQ